MIPNDQRMNISDEAVEAAAKVMAALGEADNGESGWPDFARAALEAAAPHIIAAWINGTSRLPRDLPGYGPEGSVGAGE